MLNYVLEMVTKAKRVLFVLQQKDNHLRRLIETNDLDWRRRHGDLLTQTEDRIVEIRRKAEETVLEIKRQSIIDLQKAVSQTEQKSNDLLLREREQYQRLKSQTFEEAYALLNRQEDGPEVRFSKIKIEKILFEVFFSRYILAMLALWSKSY